MEGVDCAGKGEICRRLAHALNAVLYKTPPEKKREEQDRINATASDADHYRYFVDVIKSASKEIADFSANCNVVIDRYWITTVVYHRVMGLSAKLEDMGGVVTPDITVYLTVSPEVQARRMAARGMSEGDKRMDGRQHLIREMYEKVLATQANVVRVHTDQLTPDEAVEMILSQCPQSK